MSWCFRFGRQCDRDKRTNRANGDSGDDEGAEGEEEVEGGGDGFDAGRQQQQRLLRGMSSSVRININGDSNNNNNNSSSSSSSSAGVDGLWAPLSSHAEEAISLSFKDVSYSTLPSKNAPPQFILHKVTGHIDSGKLLAIMGPSGAGKTTLLDVLAGRQKSGTLSGSVLVNGRERMDLASFRRISGYVMQDDALIGNLTVRETLTYSLALRAPHFPKLERKRLLKSILSVLNLTGVVHSRIGTPLSRGISGGERRRVYIGVELVTLPKILFLDEPTSGLDSKNALKVMKALVNLCMLGTTVVCTIHQPRSNIFALFDRLLLMHQGQTVFFGPSLGSLDFLARLGLACPSFINPADFILDLIEDEKDLDLSRYVMEDNETGKSSISPATLVDAYESSSEKVDVCCAIEEIGKKATTTQEEHVLDRLEKNAKYPASFWRQYVVLTSRTWRATRRDPAVMYVRTIAALLIGVLVGGIFFQLEDSMEDAMSKVNGMLFVTCIFSLFALPAVSKYIDDRLLYQRERAGGHYRTSAYFFATFTVEIPILMVVVLLYCVISYWMMNLHPTVEHFLYFLGVVSFTILCGYSLSQLIGAGVSQVNMALAIYTVCLVYALLLGGFIVSVDMLPYWLQWIVFTSYFYYGFEGLCINEFEDKSYGQEVLQKFSFENSNKWVDLSVLVLLFFCLRAGSYLLLRYAQQELR